MEGLFILIICAFIGWLELQLCFKPTVHEFVAKESREKYFDDREYLIKRDSGVDVRLVPYYKKIYVYDKKDPYYRTIAFKNVATTELVDDSGWKVGICDKTNKYKLVVNNTWWNDRLYLDKSLVESAKSVQIPHLLFDKHKKAYCIDLRDNTGLKSQYPTDIFKEEQFIAETNSLLSEEEGEKIVRWMKGYDN